MPIAHIEAPGRVRTRIVATVGPASQNPAVLRRLVEAGVDLIRLNFSHGTHEDHTAVLETIREIARETERSLGVLQDLGGPKIRLGAIPGDLIDCHEGDSFTLSAEPADVEDPRQLTCTYRDLVGDLQAGETIYLADGLVAMQVVEVKGATAHLVVTQAGRIRSRQGLNLPGTELKVKALTEKDLKDLDWTARHEIDYVGLSFVQRPEDVVWLRRELETRGAKARIVAKIEKPQALLNLDGILQETDAVMIARGDLGVEIDVAKVPAIQKRIITACRAARIPVITATQMLASMESSSRPTRAEASDVFNAILDGSDAVMLSGETAIGTHPIHAVAMMSRIASEAEAVLAEREGWVAPPPSTRGRWITPITESVVEAASVACRRLNAALVVVVTQTGRSALAVSQYRNMSPTLALVSDDQIARWMNLYWGVTPLVVRDINDHEETLKLALEWARSHGMIGSGDRVVLMRGASPDSDLHNGLLVHQEP